jgi:hypothetical protein
MLISLIYASNATRLLTKDELLEILRVSHDNNARLGITGMLLYKGGNFMQVLEGPEEAVNEIYERIVRDMRHAGIVKLSSRPIEERQFEKWEMAFVDMDADEIKHEPAYSKFLQDDLTAEKYRQTPDLASIMLLTFRDGMR